MDVVIVGAGVIGLTCAVRLGRAGHRVRIWARAEPAPITSAVAGGLVYPRHEEPAHRCAEWTAQSMQRFAALAADDKAGVRMVPGRIQTRGRLEWPPWADAMDDLRRVAAAPPWADTLALTAPLVDTTRYLPWLERQALDAGVELVARAADSLDDPRRAGAELVVNAAGLDGGRLAGDATLTPVRGQVVHVANPGLREWLVDEDDPAGISYVIAHRDHVVCGGTEEYGGRDLAVDPEASRLLLRRCRQLCPAIRDAPVLRELVGLRPARPQVRLDRVGDTIHCYGHGGAGVTLSWGCAAEVERLAC